jgi:AcrR family transcriptional regulator
MSSPPIKVTTIDRILDTSLKLFNEQSFHCVPAMRIAENLGISPGHLAYHFKNKSEILLALFPRLESALKEIMQLDLPHVAPKSIERNLYVLKTLWNYRFFFIELPQIAPVDKNILDSYLKLEDRILGMIRDSFDARIAEGIMRPVLLPNTTELLSKNVWITWLDWIRREQLRHPGQATPDASSVYEAMLRSYCIAQPYLPDNFLDEIVEALKARLATHMAPDAKTSQKRAAANKRATPRKVG